MATFEVRRTSRRALLWGVAWLLTAVGVAAALGIATHAPQVAPWAIGAGGIGYFVAAIVANIPRKGSIEVAPGVVVPSWRSEIRVESVPVGTWALAGHDTAHGLIAHVRGGGGKLRVGGERHTGAGYELAAAPSRSVDCQLDAASFDAFVAALGVARGGSEVVSIPLAKNTVGKFPWGMMLPWFLTMAAAGGFGVAASALGMESVFGQAVTGGGTMAIVLVGIVITVLRAQRLKKPPLELRLRRGELALARPNGDEVAHASWQSITVTPRVYTFSYRGTYHFPVLELDLGGAEPIHVCVWDPSLAWRHDVPRVKARPYLVGVPHWPVLVAALRSHGKLRNLP